MGSKQEEAMGMGDKPPSYSASNSMVSSTDTRTSVGPSFRHQKGGEGARAERNMAVVQSSRNGSDLVDHGGGETGREGLESDLLGKREHNFSRLRRSCCCLVGHPLSIGGESSWCHTWPSRPASHRCGRPALRHHWRARRSP